MKKEVSHDLFVVSMCLADVDSRNTMNISPAYTNSSNDNRAMADLPRSSGSESFNSTQLLWQAQTMSQSLPNH